MNIERPKGPSQKSIKYGPPCYDAPQGVHLVHFKNNAQHNIRRIKFIRRKIYKGVPYNEGSIKSRQSHYKYDQGRSHGAQPPPPLTSMPKCAKMATNFSFLFCDYNFNYFGTCNTPLERVFKTFPTVYYKPTNSKKFNW
jgi:hypothetical protein